MNIKSQKDFFSGLMFLVIGGAFALGATSYTIGTSARMGPGYFPMMLGVIMAILGAVVLFYSLIVETPGGDPVTAFAWKPIIYILGATKRRSSPTPGMFAAIYLLTILASKAGNEFKIKEVLILGTILSLISYLAFIVLLKLQMPIWPEYITG